MKKFFINYHLRILFTVGIVMCGILHSGLKSEAASPEKQAPGWVISEWINSAGLTLEDLQGKVIVIDFFHICCQGCNKF